MLGKKPWVSGCWRSITRTLVPRSTMVPETRTTQGSPAWGCSWHVIFPLRHKMERLPGDEGRDWLQKIWQPGTTGLPTGHPGTCRTRRTGGICSETGFWSGLWLPWSCLPLISWDKIPRDAPSSRQPGVLGGRLLANACVGVLGSPYLSEQVTLLTLQPITVLSAGSSLTAGRTSLPESHGVKDPTPPHP